MESVGLFMSVFYALSFMVLTVVLITVNWRAANGRLQRNQWAGIRIPSTMRSDQAWVAGHRAALRLTPLYLLVLAGLLTALFVAVLCVSTGVAMLVGIGGLFVYVPVALYSAFVANRAAKAADKYPDDRYRQ